MVFGWETLLHIGSGYVLKLICDVELLDVEESALFDPCLGIDGLCLPSSSPLICLVDPVEVVDAHFAPLGVGSRG